MENVICLSWSAVFKTGSSQQWQMKKATARHGPLLLRVPQVALSIHRQILWCPHALLSLVLRNDVITWRLSPQLFLRACGISRPCKLWHDIHLLPKDILFIDRGWANIRVWIWGFRPNLFFQVSFMVVHKYGIWPSWNYRMVEIKNKRTENKQPMQELERLCVRTHKRAWWQF